MSHIPTDDELTAIRARAEAATDGKLSVIGDEGQGGWHVVIDKAAVCYGANEDDAALFASARRDVLTLLAEVERLRAENASLRESLDLSDMIINSEAVK